MFGLDENGELYTSFGKCIGTFFYEKETKKKYDGEDFVPVSRRMCIVGVAQKDSLTGHVLYWKTMDIDTLENDRVRESATIPIFKPTKEMELQIAPFLE